MEEQKFNNQMENANLNPGVNAIEDLREGMILQGIVNNVASFGAFVNIGVEQDGLIHISQLADRFVSDPKEIVRPRQQVRVKVLEVDLGKRRISLSMKNIDEDND